MRVVDAMIGGRTISVEMAALAGRIASRDLVERDARYALLILLQALDIATTTLVLSWGGTEQNPLAELLTSVGPSGLVALLLLKLLLVWRVYELTKNPDRFLSIDSTAFSTAAGNNRSCSRRCVAHSIVRWSPSRRVVCARNPKKRSAFRQSRERRGCPAGLEESKRNAPS